MYAYLLELDLFALASASPLCNTAGPTDVDPIVPGLQTFPLHILPLGDSIAWGQKSSDGNGYRQYLREMLEQHIASVDMVGTVQSGHMKDNNCEGHPGARVHEVAAYADHAIRFQPNVILINAGTNDAINEAPDHLISKIGEQMDHLIDHLFDKIPGTTIVFSTLLINMHNDAYDRIRNIINSQYQSLVQRRQEKYQRILLADLYHAVKAEDLVDGTHPNDKGYKDIAGAWVKAISEAGAQRMLEWPSNAPLTDSSQTSCAVPTRQSKAQSIPSQSQAVTAAIQESAAAPTNKPLYFDWWF